MSLKAVAAAVEQKKAKPKFVKVGGKIVPVDDKGNLPPTTTAGADEAIARDVAPKPQLRKALQAIQKKRQAALEIARKRRDRGVIKKGKI